MLIVNVSTAVSFEQEEEWLKCCVPVVDVMNHAPVFQPLLPGGGPFHPGAQPAVAVELSQDSMMWVARRQLNAGEEVSWTYGSLSSEQLFLRFAPILVASASRVCL